MQRTHLLLTGCVHIKPRDQQIAASLRMVLNLPHVGEHILFLLHRGLQLQSVSGAGVLDWEPDDAVAAPFSPEAEGIRVRLQEIPGGNEPIRLHLAYSGRIGVTEWRSNRITAEWVELGLYSPWFPLMMEGPNPLPLDYDLEVTVEGGYQLAGAVERTARGWRLVSERTGQDALLLAAPEFHRLSRTDGNVAVEVQLTRRDDLAAAGELAQGAVELLGFYRDWFHDDGGREVTAVIAPRRIGGGYVRGPLMVLSVDVLEGMQTRELGIFKWLAHEIAHLWWNRAPSGSWEDWLNESIAEYCALRAVAAHHSEEGFVKLMSEKRQKMPGLPPVRGLERTSPRAHEVLYGKGCVLMGDLQRMMGETGFTALLRRLAAMQTLSTEVFLAELSDVAGERVASTFAGMLNR